MAFQTLAVTEHFILQFEDDPAFPKAPVRAQAVCDVAESEFDTLAGWFLTHSGFGTGPGRKQLTVQVVGHIATDGVRGFTRGYEDGKIVLDSYDDRGDSGSTAVRHAFIHELAHVMTDYRHIQSNGATWEVGDSNSEALAQFCSIERGPDTFYSDFADASVGLWLWGHRHEDYVTQPHPHAGESSDDPVEVAKRKRAQAAALLFLYYLKSQWRIPVSDIIQKGGANLEAAFATLIGRVGGYAAVTFLLDKYFPADLPLPPRLPRDDVFPLLEVPDRQVFLKLHSEPVGNAVVIGMGMASESFLGCAARDYHFDIVRHRQQVHCEFETIGFGLLQHPEWFVNDVQLPLPKTSGHVDIQAMVTRDDPRLPLGGTSAVELVDASFSVLLTLNQGPDWSTLFVDFPQNDGTVELKIRVRVRDQQFAPAVATEVEERYVVRNRQIVFEDAYDDDMKRCLDRFLRNIRGVPTRQPFDPRARVIQIVSGLAQSPAHDLRRSIRDLRDLSAAVQFIDREHGPDRAQELMNYLHVTLGLDAAVMKALAPPVAPRARPTPSRRSNRRARKPTKKRG